jgi:hypothetical protein
VYHVVNQEIEDYILKLPLEVCKNNHINDKGAIVYRVVGTGANCADPSTHLDRESIKDMYKIGAFDGDMEIVRASSYRLGDFVVGFRVIPKGEVLLAGKRLSSMDDIERFEKYGIYQVHPDPVAIDLVVHPDPANRKATAKYFGFHFLKNVEGHRSRWLNMSKVMGPLVDGIAPCKLLRKFPSIGPKGCSIAKDWVGRDIDGHGEVILEIQLPQDDRKALFDMTINGHLKQALLDTGAQRNELSMAFAKEMGFYDGLIDKEEVFDAGAVVYGNNQRTTVNGIRLEVGMTYGQFKHASAFPFADRSESLLFIYPKTYEETAANRPYSVIIGREGLAALRIRLGIKGL